MTRAMTFHPDREPQPSDGPDYCTDHDAWDRRQTSEVRHPFRPALLANGEPTLVCRRCGEWFDHPDHGPVAR